MEGVGVKDEKNDEIESFAGCCYGQRWMNDAVSCECVPA